MQYLFSLCFGSILFVHLKVHVCTEIILINGVYITHTDTVDCVITINSSSHSLTQFITPTE